MASGVTPLERALILRWPKCAAALGDSQDDAALRPAVDLYDTGRFREAEAAAMRHPQHPMAPLLAAVCCIDRFIAANWTGPCPTEEPLASAEEEAAALGVDGESALPGGRGVGLVSAAKAHLDRSAALPTEPWWHARLALLHQRLMASPCASLKEDIDRGLSAAIALAARADDTALELCALIERAAAHVWYREAGRARKVLERAMALLGLRVELSGAQGRRTKYQEKDTPQLYLAVLDQQPRPQESNAWKEHAGGVPNEVQLGVESDLLEYPRFSDAIDAFVLLPPEQACVLLLGALHVMRAAEAGDDVRREEALAFCNRVLRDPCDWSVQAMALLAKSRLEKYGHKTAERALSQLQSLSALFSSPPASASAEEKLLSAKARIARQHLVLYSPHVELRRELGNRLAAMGDPAAAVRLFEETGMLDEAVLCLAASGQKAKAEELCRRRLEQCATPEMLCVLGDITDEKEHYERAWTGFGNKKFARAQRSLGHWHIKRQHWAEAIQHYRLALAANSLFDSCWFALGCAAMQLSRWTEALEAFTRVVALEPEDGEAWSNIAAVHMHTGNAQGAHSSLQEALRHKPDSWRILQNFVLICSSPQMRDYRGALFGIGRLLDLSAAFSSDEDARAAKRVDPRVLFALVTAVLENKPTRTGDGSAALRPQLEKILLRIERDGEMSPALWDISAMYAEAREDWRTAQGRRSHQAHSLEGSWPGDARRWADVSEAYIALARVSLKLADPSCVPRLQTAIDRARQHHAATAPFATLVALTAKLSALVQPH